jgi:hypothetical protein
LPIWREGHDNNEAMSLAQDIQRFFDIYERNLDRDLPRKLLGGGLSHPMRESKLDIRICIYIIIYIYIHVMVAVFRNKQLPSDVVMLGCWLQAQVTAIY